MSIKVKDLLPLIWYNDIRLVVGTNEEICLIRKDFNKKNTFRRVSQYGSRMYRKRRMHS